MNSMIESTNPTSEVASTAADEAREVTDVAKQQAERLAADAKEHAGDIVRRTTDELRTMADQRTTQLCSGLRDLGRQFSAVGTDERPTGIVADLSQEAGRRLADIADRLDRDGFDGMLAQARSTARRRPAMFLAGAAAAGFLAARVVRDSMKVVSVADERPSVPSVPSAVSTAPTFEAPTIEDSEPAAAWSAPTNLPSTEVGGW